MLDNNTREQTTTKIVDFAKQHAVLSTYTGHDWGRCYTALAPQAPAQQIVAVCWCAERIIRNAFGALTQEDLLKVFRALEVQTRMAEVF